MDESGKQNLIKLYRLERLHQQVYESLSKTEKNNEIKIIMATLVKLERMHGDLWGELISILNIRKPLVKINFEKSVILFARRIFGLAIMMKMIEYNEGSLHKKFYSKLQELRPNRHAMEIVRKIQESEGRREAQLETTIVQYGHILNNIRDVMFGMNDGLVELLGVSVGLAAALETPLIVFLAGFIVAISGTLSMAAGAYLSTGYEKEVKKRGRESALSSAFYVGIFYFVGALFPLAPFAFGYLGYTAILLAIVFTAIVLTLTSSLIALASDKSIPRAIAKTLLISLGVAIVTILLGIYVRSAFHISTI